MGCCKGSVKDELNQKAIEKFESKSKVSIKDYVIKVILFLILGSILSIVIIPLSLFVLFRIVVLSKDIDLMPLVYYLGKKLLVDKDEEDDDDIDEEDEEGDEENYELDDADEVIVLN